MEQSTICLIIFALTICLYLMNKFPLGLVSLISVMALTVTGCVSASTVLSKFSNSSVVVTLGMMVVGAALNRTSLISRTTSLVRKVSGDNFTKGMIGYILIIFLVAQFMPSTVVTFILCYPWVADYCRKLGYSPSKGIFSVCLVISVTKSILPVGSGAAAFVSANAYLESFGMAGTVGMFDQMIVKLPSCIVAIVCAIWVCPRFAPDHGDLLGIEVSSGRKQVEKPPLDKKHEIYAIAIFVATFFAILFSDYLPLEVWQITTIAALLVVASGVLSEREAISSMYLPAVFILIGSLTLGTAMLESGAAQVACDFIKGIFGQNPSPFIVMFVLWMITFSVTQLMSNTALLSSIMPVVLLLCNFYGWNPVGPFYLIHCAAFVAFLSPLAEPAMPVCMQAGQYTQKEVLKMGWIPALIMTLVMTPWVMFIRPL